MPYTSTDALNVFLSYASEDGAIAEALASTLRAASSTSLVPRIGRIGLVGALRQQRDVLARDVAWPGAGSSGSRSSAPTYPHRPHKWMAKSDSSRGGRSTTKTTSPLQRQTKVDRYLAMICIDDPSFEPSWHPHQGGRAEPRLFIGSTLVFP